MKIRFNSRYAYMLTLMFSTAALSQEESPNLLLFLADDCTYRDLGCYGSVDSKTPYIDGFAKEGMRFTNCFQAVPMSSPTRHNLYTGLWPVRSGAFPNHTFADEGVKSIVHHLRPAGYKVALIGKSHVLPETVFPFDLYIPSLKDGGLDYETIEHFTKDCRDSDTPFCLFVCSNEPHSPWNKGNPDLFDKDRISLPPYYVDVPELRSNFVRYLAEVNYMDAEFGKVLNILDDNELKDRTVVVFLSEQGNDLPFAKWTCYDAGVHSGCIVRWPEHIEPGTESDAIVEYVDIVPTFLDIAGVKPVSALDGKSFLPVLEQKKKEHKLYTFSMQTSRGIYSGGSYYGIRSVADKRYRYILNLTPEVTFSCYTTKRPFFKKWQEQALTDKEACKLVTRYQRRPAIELYDVIKDPYCMQNLAENPQFETTIKRYAKVLELWMAECGDKGQQTELEAWLHMTDDKSGLKDKIKK